MAPRVAKKDALINFRADEAFEEWLMKASFALDMTRSEFIREVLLHGYQSFKEKRLEELGSQHSRYQV